MHPTEHGLIGLLYRCILPVQVVWHVGYIGRQLWEMRNEKVLFSEPWELRTLWEHFELCGLSVSTHQNLLLLESAFQDALFCPLLMESTNRNTVFILVLLELTNQNTVFSPLLRESTNNTSDSSRLIANNLTRTSALKINNLQPHPVIPSRTVANHRAPFAHVSQSQGSICSC